MNKKINNVLFLLYGNFAMLLSCKAFDNLCFKSLQELNLKFNLSPFWEKKNFVSTGG